MSVITDRIKILKRRKSFWTTPDQIVMYNRKKFLQVVSEGLHQTGWMDKLELFRGTISISSVYYYYMYYIYPYTEATLTLVHAFTSTKINHMNALFYGIPKYLMNKHQWIQNNAA